MSEPTTPTGKRLLAKPQRRPNVSNLDTIRKRHVKHVGTFAFCECCEMEWPCDARVVLDALDSAQHHNRTVYSALAERDDARADADRLAEALRLVHFAWHVGVNCKRSNCYAYDALRQHDGSDPAEQTDRTDPRHPLHHATSRA